MSFKLELSKDRFTISNTVAETMFAGTAYDYHHIEFNTKGFLHFLQEYLQFENLEANYLHMTIENWVEFNILTTIKE